LVVAPVLEWILGDHRANRAQASGAPESARCRLFLMVDDGICPLTDLAGRIKEPARMCRKPIFSSPAAKIPLFDLDRVKGMGQSRRATLRRLFSAQAR
jgi:hypothetical protein